MKKRTKSKSQPRKRRPRNSSRRTPGRPARSRPMTPEQMVQFEKHVVQSEDEPKPPPKTLIPM